MPTLVFADNFSAAERRVYSTFFTFACKELGIERHDASVLLMKQPLRSISRGLITRVGDDSYLVVVNGDKDHFDGTFGLCHELVHLRQYLRGQIDTKEDGVHWCGDVIPHEIASNDFFYMALPWEQEAHAVGPQVHERAILTLAAQRGISA